MIWRARSVSVALSRAKADLPRPGAIEVQLPPPRGRARKLLNRERGRIRARVLIAYEDGSGNKRVVTRRLWINRKPG